MEKTKKAGKKILAVILTLLLAAAAGGCRSEFEKRFGDYTPSLWYIENEAGNRIYLFGSIHVGVQSMYPMPDEVWKPFTESKNLCVETDVTGPASDVPSIMSMFDLLQYPDGSSLKDHLSSEEAARLNEAAEKAGIPPAFDLGSLPYKPIFATMTLEEFSLTKTDYDISYGVDLTMINYAKENGIAVKDIEGVTDVYSKLGSMPDDTQIFLLNNTVSSILHEDTDIQQEIDELFQSWANGSIFTAHEAEEEYDSAEEKKQYDIYNDVLLYSRNITMADKAEEYLASGESHFFVVGAAHYPGDKGIIRLLEDRGHTVIPVEY